MQQSISFDRVADKYDETRGGLRRGREVAAAVAPHLLDSPVVLEVGVGTAVVAFALTEIGRTVVGVDLSPNMLARARSRIGTRVACADAHALPFGDQRFSNAYIIWVLHLVADPVAVMTECARVLRPGGRLVVAAGRPRTQSDEWTEITTLLQPLDRFRDERLNNDNVEGVQRWAAAAGLRRIALLEREEHFEEAPSVIAMTIEERAYSYLWNVDDATWAAVVEPLVDALRRLPEPDRPRAANQVQPLHVFER